MGRFITLTALCVLAVSCGPEETVAVRPLVAQEKAKPPEGGTLTRRLDGDISSVNPVLIRGGNDRYINPYLFTPLVYLDRDLRPIPGLARHWEVSGDGLTYRFELDPKATWSDGTPVRATDVLFTLAKIADPETQAVHVASSFSLLDLSRSRVLDERTVEIVFREVLSSQLARFSDVMILPEHVYSKGDFKNDYLDRAVGSGPYRLVRREHGKETVVERRDDYWGLKPEIKTVVFKVIEDNGTAWNAIKHGDIDETLITSDTWLQERDKPANANLRFQLYNALGYDYIAWNNRDPLLSDKRIRRALAMCIPVAQIIDTLYKGTARAMAGPYTADELGYDPTVTPVGYDPAEALRILREAGWRDADGDGVLEKDGRPFKLDLLLMAGNPTTRQLSQVMQDELKKVGVHMEIVQLDPTTVFERVGSGNYQAAYMSWALDADPDIHGIFHSSQFAPAGKNWVFYANPEVDRLIDAGRRELDQAKRKQIYQRLHRIIAEDQPYAWIVQSSAKWVVRDRVRGITLSPGYGPYLWHPGELEWWIPREEQERRSP